MNQNNEPFVRIIEQPARSAVRFRYECEGRSAGPIPGVSSSSTCATYPTIQVMNYSGVRAMVMVSCVTVSPPYRQHPHHLVGRVGCHNGICTIIIDNNDHICTFTHLGIQCAKRNEISSRLKQRKQMQIDPTNAGFEHITKSSRSIDLGAIRLCFQVYIEDPITGKLSIALDPVISDAVHDKKLLPKLIITDISTTSSSMSGGKVMIFCNYIDEDDIEVRFFETDNNGVVIWESIADLKPPIGEVHKRVGISLLAPAYPNPHVKEAVNVYLQLRRPSDQRSSDPLIFTYLPDCYHDNCPLIKFNQMNSSEVLSFNTIKRSKNKSNSAKMKTNKKIKVLDIINGSDSESNEEECHTSGNYECNDVQEFIQNESQFLNLTPDKKVDLNNNYYNNYQSNGNDVLVECLRTIDLDYLNQIDFQEYTGEEDWPSLNNTIHNSNNFHTNQ
jgi:Rel/ankyrin family protein